MAAGLILSGCGGGLSLIHICVAIRIAEVMLRKHPKNSRQILIRSRMTHLLAPRVNRN